MLVKSKKVGNDTLYMTLIEVNNRLYLQLKSETWCSGYGHGLSMEEVERWYDNFSWSDTLNEY